MFKQTISQDTCRLLAILAKNNFIQKAYLAGGTALALQLGHRISYDLDFFTQTKFNEQQFLANLKKISSFQEERIDWQTIIGNFAGIKFSIFYYEYPLIKKPQDFLGINLVYPEDIAAMKIAAVSSRGTKRDFIDLYFLAKHGFSLRKMLKFYDQKFKNLEDLFSHIVKSLMYFEDAENDEMPHMLKKCGWNHVKKFFLSEVPKVVDEEIGKKLINA